jgi:hypothetical protein
LLGGTVSICACARASSTWREGDATSLAGLGAWLLRPGRHHIVPVCGGEYSSSGSDPTAQRHNVRQPTVSGYQTSRESGRRRREHDPARPVFATRWRRSHSWAVGDVSAYPTARVRAISTCWEIDATAMEHGGKYSDPLSEAATGALDSEMRRCLGIPFAGVCRKRSTLHLESNLPGSVLGIRRTRDDGFPHCLNHPDVPG